jgi:hypothetical protein
MGAMGQQHGPARSVREAIVDGLERADPSLEGIEDGAINAVDGMTEFIAAIARREAGEILTEREEHIITIVLERWALVQTRVEPQVIHHHPRIIHTHPTQVVREVGQWFHHVNWIAVIIGAIIGLIVSILILTQLDGTTILGSLDDQTHTRIAVKDGVDLWWWEVPFCGLFALAGAALGGFFFPRREA